MNDYKIKKLYEEMELHLIQSMKRNLGRHLTEENEVGFKYPQWQAEKLKELKRYQRENKKIIGRYTLGLDEDVSEHLQNELRQGSIKAIKQYNEITGDNLNPSKIMNKSFFRTNDKKVDALIKVVNDDLKTANTSALRMANDQYRQIIHKSAFFVGNGVFTEKQAAAMAVDEISQKKLTTLAIDEASKNFLTGGLNCIEYSDGRRVNIASYSQMAIRTASLRSQLMGEGDFRASIGRTLVKVTTHGGACPLCTKWQGKVLIDDVYSGGTSKDGNYTLLSDAMKQGFLHPNCRHGLTTYYPELDEDDEVIEPVSEREEKLQQTLNYYNRNIKSYNRLAVGSLDSNNRKTYETRKKTFQYKKDFLRTVLNQKNRHVSISQNLSRVIDKDLSKEIIADTSYYISKYKDLIPNENKDIMWILGDLTYTKNSVAFANDNFQINMHIINDVNKFKNLVRLAQKQGSLVKTNDPVRQIVGHEIGHRVQIGLYRKVSGNMDATRDEAENWVKKFMRDVVDEYEKRYPKKTPFIDEALSKYGASVEYEMFSEAFAEYTSSINPRPFARTFGIMFEEVRRNIK